MSFSSSKVPEHIQKAIRNSIENYKSSSDDNFYVDLLIAESCSTVQLPKCTVKFHSNNQGEIETQNEQGRFRTDIFAHSGDINSSISTWLLAVSNHSLTINTLSISQEGTVDEKRISSLVETLACACERYPNSIRATKLNIKMDMEEEHLIKVLSSFDSSILEEILIISNVTDICGIARTEQWKKCKCLMIDKLNNIPVAEFFNAEQFSTTVEELGAEDAWRCVENFLSRDLPRESFFHIQTMNPFDAPSVLAKIQCKTASESGFKISSKEVPINIGVEGFTSKFLHTFQFELANPSLNLVVLIAENEISGSICHVDHVEEDCEMLFSEHLNR